MNDLHFTSTDRISVRDLIEDDSVSNIQNINIITNYRMIFSSPERRRKLKKSTAISVL